MKIQILAAIIILPLLMSCQSAPRAGLETEVDQRMEQVLAHFRSNPIEAQPVTQHPVLSHLTFSRHFNVSRSARAYLQLMTDPSQDRSSGELLEEVADYYLAHPEEIPDPDATYWAGEYHAAALARFGTNGSVRPGAVPRPIETKLLEYMVAYVDHWSRPDRYDFSLSHQTYYYWNSENHWWQEIVTAWGYLLVLKDDPDFKDTVLSDGLSLQEHYDASVSYMKEHMRQRARKGFLIEISSGGYSGRMHNMYLMIHDLSPDEDLRELASKTLDLWWGFWAEEQITGERGGGKVRHRRLRGLLPNSEVHMVPAWYYFGIGARDMDFITGLPNSSGVMAANYLQLLSDYRPAPFVSAILNDRRDAPAYSITQRRIGKSAGQDDSAPPEILNIERTRYDRDNISRHKFYDFANSDVLKYSWVSPNFVLGTNMRPPHDVQSWVAGSAQGWWHGLLLNSRENAYPERVVPTLLYPRDAMGEQYAVQSKGSLMTRKLDDAWSPSMDNGPYPMGVFISEGLLDDTSVDDGVIFIDSPTAWVAVRTANTVFTEADQMLSQAQRRAGSFYMLKDDDRPLIIEAAEHGEYQTFEAFQDAVRRAALVYETGAYHYDSLSGDRLSMFDDRAPPMINTQPVDYAPQMAYDSRYIRSAWDSGVITIRVGDETFVQDFTVH